MHIVKVDATTSTNTLARSILNEVTHNMYAVSAEFQTAGRGQQNSNWQSAKSENLTFTVVYKDLKLAIENSFLLNIVICIALVNVLKNYLPAKINFKWPNDILADGKKICGILIENNLSGNFIKTSFVGIGLNVNQINFENLPDAISMSALLNKTLDRDKLLIDLTYELEDIQKVLKENTPENIVNTYKLNLFKFNKISSFKFVDGTIEKGKIIDVELDGHLKIQFDSGKQRRFRHKEINLFL